MTKYILIILLGINLFSCEPKNQFHGIWQLAYELDSENVPTFPGERLLLDFYSDKVNIISVGNPAFSRFDEIVINQYSVQFGDTILELQSAKDTIIYFLHEVNPDSLTITPISLITDNTMVLKKLQKRGDRVRQADVTGKKFDFSFQEGDKMTVHFLSDKLLSKTEGAKTNDPFKGWTISNYRDYSFLNINDPYYLLFNIYLDEKGNMKLYFNYEKEIIIDLKEVKN